ncbi:hypothetical protein [Acinetobacter sp.]|uniref:hypothetical protein n=1 Tax=Acinetobacter sp. TaxID=472 RepID=UPI0028211BF6|nr:hypothetical protein [Acinetobacter sp.]MDR0237280.1 hypothetical protein [Acinetobacter sp.]
MNTFSFTQSEHARLELLQFIKNSLSAELWEQNVQAISQLKQQTIQHALFQHPLLDQLNQSQLSLEQLKFIHTNYFTAIVKNFTDALSMAIYQAVCLEKNNNIQQKNRIASKIYARYLLSLNLIDELGFNTYQLEQSSASKSHLVYFLKLMQQLSLNPLDQGKTQAEAFALADYIYKHLNSYTDLLLILACTELQVIKFSEALRNNMSNFNSIYIEGYYACHGLADQDGSTLANDDNHEDDIWTLLTQCLTPENEQHLHQIQTEYLALWNNFWNKMAFCISTI